jgi:hypothetical protein
MLILDKRKAVERMVALTTAAGAAFIAEEAEEGEPEPRRRTYQKIATYERRRASEYVPAARRVTARARGRPRHVGGMSTA